MDDSMTYERILIEWMIEGPYFCLRIGADAGESLVSMKVRNAEQLLRAIHET